MTYNDPGEAFTAWFKRTVVWVTHCVPVPAAILARSASEGSGYPRLRFGLICRGCYPQLNQAAFTTVLSANARRRISLTKREFNKNAGRPVSVRQTVDN